MCHARDCQDCVDVILLEGKRTQNWKDEFGLRPQQCNQQHIRMVEDDLGCWTK